VMSKCSTPASCCAMPDASGLPGLRRGAVVTVGTFDGVHRGHRDILRRLVECSAREGLPSLVVTFRPHPVEVIKPSAAPPHIPPDGEQREGLVDSGVEYVVVLPFTPALAALGARDFVERLLIARYGVRTLVVGYDHGFGRGREGDASTLV